VSKFVVAFLLASAGLLVGASSADAAGNKVVIIVLENMAYSKVIGSAEAPYINSLSHSGTLFTDYHAVVAGSLHDYLAMTSGQTEKPGTGTLPNIFFDLDQASRTWKSFEESMAGSCGVRDGKVVPGSSEKLYVRGHDPAYLLRKSYDSCTANDVPMTTATFDPASLPNLSFVIPNQCDDGHTFPTRGDCPAFFGNNQGGTRLGVADRWVSKVVGSLLLQPDVTIILTWDEGGKSSAQHIVTIEAGAGVPSGGTDPNTYDHYSLLAGLYAYFNLGTAPANGATATPLPIP
jgi:hypothetical protein